MAVRTITLTNARPVRIEEDNWPIIAQASGEKDRSTNHIIVRHHADGRTIVYAVRLYIDEYHRAGLVLDESVTLDNLLPYISSVGEAAGVPDGIIRQCISDLPPVDLG